MKIEYGCLIIGNNQMPYRCFAKLFCTWSPQDRRVRFGRIVWARRNPQGGLSAMLSFGMEPKLFSWWSGYKNWSITVLGLRLHYSNSLGGWHA